MLKEKPEGTNLAFKSFIAKNGTKYLVFKSLDGSFHVFTEVEAKQAARDCGADDLGNTRQMWESLWEQQP